MGDHVKVNTRELAAMGRTLAQLRSDFENGSNIVGSYHGAFGSSQLSSAMDDFASD